MIFFFIIFLAGKDLLLFFDSQELSILSLDALRYEILNDVLGMEQSPENTSFIRGMLAQHRLY